MVCGGSWSFRVCGGLPRGVAVLGDRRPFRRNSAAWHTRAKGSAQAVKNLTFVAVPKLKRNTSPRPPSALILCLVSLSIPRPQPHRLVTSDEQRMKALMFISVVRHRWEEDQLHEQSTNTQHRLSLNAHRVAIRKQVQRLGARQHCKENDAPSPLPGGLSARNCATR